jgi:hypothetical protein
LRRSAINTAFVISTRKTYFVKCQATALCFVFAIAAWELAEIRPSRNYSEGYFFGRESTLETTGIDLVGAA